jgi:hypothetical protein
MTDIYESPDGGHTIYVRKHGSNERSLYKEDTYAKNIKRQQEWYQIWSHKDSNPALQKAVERVIMIYRLSKDNG